MNKNTNSFAEDTLKIKMIERYPVATQQPKTNYNKYYIMGAIAIICLLPFIKNPIISKLKINNLIYISILFILNLLILCLIK
jgi:hypothetical protein